MKSSTVVTICIHLICLNEFITCSIKIARKPILNRVSLKSRFRNIVELTTISTPDSANAVIAEEEVTTTEASVIEIETNFGKRNKGTKGKSYRTRQSTVRVSEWRALVSRKRAAMMKWCWMTMNSALFEAFQDCNTYRKGLPTSVKEKCDNDAYGAGTPWRNRSKLYCHFDTKHVDKAIFCYRNEAFKVWKRHNEPKTTDKRQRQEYKYKLKELLSMKTLNDRLKLESHCIEEIVKHPGAVIDHMLGNWFDWYLCFLGPVITKLPIKKPPKPVTDAELDRQLAIFFNWYFCFIGPNNQRVNGTIA